MVAFGVLVEAVLPEIPKAATGVEAAEGQDFFRAGFGPEHARLFAAGADDGLATGFHHARANEPAVFPKGAILHPVDVALKIAQGLGHRLRLRLAGDFLVGFLDQVLHPVFEQAG